MYIFGCIIFPLPYPYGMPPELRSSEQILAFVKMHLGGYIQSITSVQHNACVCIHLFDASNNSESKIDIFRSFITKIETWNSDIFFSIRAFYENSPDYFSYSTPKGDCE